jgi:hypothetical protein
VPGPIDRPAWWVVLDVAVHVVLGRGNGPHIHERRDGDVADEGVSHLERGVAVAHGRPRRGRQ